MNKKSKDPKLVECDFLKLSSIKKKCKRYDVTNENGHNSRVKL
jgi:hypothetical protein